MFWWAELISHFFTCPSGKLRTEFTSPIGKSTGPGLSDTTFFACWLVCIHFLPPSGLNVLDSRILVMDSGFLVGGTWILGFNLQRDSRSQGPWFWTPRPMMLDSTSKHVSNSGIWISLHRGYIDTRSTAADYLKQKVKKHNALLDVQCLTVPYLLE